MALTDDVPSATPTQVCYCFRGWGGGGVEGTQFHADHITSPSGPQKDRGPQVGKHCSSTRADGVPATKTPVLLVLLTPSFQNPQYFYCLSFVLPRSSVTFISVFQALHLFTIVRPLVLLLLVIYPTRTPSVAGFMSYISIKYT